MSDVSAPVARLRCRFLRLLLLIGLVAACAPKDPVVIGFIGGISGRVSDLGIAGRNAVILAVEQKNSLGGIGGRPVKLVIRDDEQNPESARRALQELIDARVVAVIGNMTSSMSAATLPLANQAGLPMISPTTTSKDFSGKDDQFFRVIASTASYAGNSARYHREHLKLARVAAIYDTGNRSYCESWLEDYRAAFEKAGGRLVGTFTFASGTAFHADNLAQQILAARPDGVLILANSVDAALLAQKIRSRDPSVRLTASEWAGTEQLIELGGRAVEGMFIPQFVDRSSQAKPYVDFRAAYRQRFGQEPGFGGVAAYDAANLLMTALEKKKAQQSVKEALLAIRNFAGVQESFSFDVNGDALRSHYLTTIRDGQFVKMEP